MKTVSQIQRIGAWSMRGAIAAIAIAASASSFADASKDGPAVQDQRDAQKHARRLCYIQMGSSAIPQPCERFLGAVPTTAGAMEIIGERPIRREAK